MPGVRRESARFALRAHKNRIVCAWTVEFRSSFAGKWELRVCEKILEDELLVTGAWSGANTPELLFNRIQHLKQRKSELERKQRLMFPDPDLENAIRAVDNEIERVQGELAKMAEERTER